MNNATHEPVDCLSSLQAFTENLKACDKGRERSFDEFHNKLLQHVCRASHHRVRWGAILPYPFRAPPLL